MGRSRRHVDRRARLATLAVLTSSLLASATNAEVALNSLFSDHMVLQRGIECPLWGTVKPNEKVSVTIDGKEVATATADAQGVFKAKLPKLEAAGPYTIVVSAGGESATVSDVLAGDVWLASGQSNMQWSLSSSNDPQKEVAEANYPNIRLYDVPRVASPTLLKDVESKWTPCTPETAKGFSAVAYFFGRRLHRELNVPIGLIHSSWGGTPAEAWTPMPKLAEMKQLPVVQAMIERTKQGVTPEAEAAYEKARQAWLKAANRLDPGIAPVAAGWEKVELEDSSGWKPMSQPGDWTQKGEANGCGWLRKTIEVPAELAGKPLMLALGRIDDYDTTFFNGQKIGATGSEHREPWQALRAYEVPAELVRAGPNVIAVRVYDLGGAAGLMGPASAMSARVGQLTIPLAGEWLWKRESVFTPGVEPPAPVAPLRPDSSGAPAALYNGMIAPLADFGIKGAIWYQGESNASRHREYQPLLSGMIESWREQFGQGDFPFYIVGLANFQRAVDDPNAHTDWAPLREAQRQVGLNVKNAATTVTIDIGESNDIHPRNKLDVGRRLALVALEETYGKTLVSRGPTLAKATFEDDKVTLAFDHTGGGLKSIREPLESFAVAGEDGVFHWAVATISGDGKRIVLHSAQVPKPTQARYAWADNPKASLFNAEGLPAEPFQVSK